MSIDDGWDGYCDRAAGGFLLRLAASLWEAAGAKGSEPIRADLERRARRAGEMALTVRGERAFRGALAGEGGDIEAIVSRVKLKAHTLRGQLMLFMESAS
jgi:hypothetical protein